ncbi:hypothetical protein JJB09_21810 [Rhizobium sp. KVB221]|uniref:Lipoprotein n=1 Tax=Rhizobium setariae TaxID=2801340 RepID=A0A936YQ42_9HYPH|nr:hypothetical protein [Rhizobium setariae]MBL0374653.1 hypothetical protein [Rhizobium setariae]
MKRTVICALLLLAGCAKMPDDISAAPVSADPYMQMSCESLASERAAKQADYDRIAKVQTETSKRDEAWMAIVHVPVASMSNGDNEPHIATLKGQLNAISKASQAKGCRV